MAEDERRVSRRTVPVERFSTRVLVGGRYGEEERRGSQTGLSPCPHGVPWGGRRLTRGALTAAGTFTGGRQRVRAGARGERVFRRGGSAGSRSTVLRAEAAGRREAGRSHARFSHARGEERGGRGRDSNWDARACGPSWASSRKTRELPCHKKGPSKHRGVGFESSPKPRFESIQ